MSDSEESDVIPVKRKRHYNITDSDDSSSGSDSSVIVAATKRVKTRLYDSSSESDSDLSIIRPHSVKGARALRSESESSESSDWQSDWSSDNQPRSESPSNLNKSEFNNYDNSSSDSNDENSEKCPICLLKLSKQEVATPETCEHVFCFECLQEWSRNVSTCPIDRKDFKVMLVRKHYHSSHRREVKVVQNKKPVEEEIIEDPTFCEICRHSDREDSMLLCDGCDLGFHMECLEPPLEQVPLGDWFCDSCVESNNSTTDEADRDLNSSRNNHSSRLIPRTRQSERVRTTVETLRVQARQFTFIDIFDPDQPSTSSGFVSNEALTKSKSITRTPRKSSSMRKSTKRTTRRKRRRVVRRRKYVTEYEICQETGAKIPVRKLVPSTTKRRTKRSSKTTRKRKVKRSKRKSSKRKSVSSKKSSSSSKLLPESGEPGVAHTLHLFGRRDELDYFSDDSEVESPISMKQRFIKKFETKKSNFSDRNISTASSSINLLDSIMESQAQMHSKKSQLAVERDGKLIIKSKHN